MKTGVSADSCVQIAFVILNYNTFEETRDCIGSIQNKIDTESYKIIVVDNASKDDSLEKLREGFDRGTQDPPVCGGGGGEGMAETLSPKIELLCNKTNLGFARGNNVGIRYVNKKYRPKFVVVLNSDTEMIQSDFFAKLDREFENSGFALLGPLILREDGRYTDSPFPIPTRENYLKDLKHLERQQKLLRWRAYKIYCDIQKLKLLFVHRLGLGRFFRKTGPVTKPKLCHHQYQKQVPLQGACLVFSRKAFEYIDGFDESTFLYREEELLYLRLMRCKLTTVFDPEICIYHKQGRATNKKQGTTREKMLFITQCLIDSDKILLRALESQEAPPF